MECPRRLNPTCLTTNDKRNMRTAVGIRDLNAMFNAYVNAFMDSDLEGSGKSWTILGSLRIVSMDSGRVKLAKCDVSTLLKIAPTMATPKTLYMEK
jgi:hypothetical protein